eukprot:1912109-Lingulodinium_polyedra.AAC.1
MNRVRPANTAEIPARVGLGQGLMPVRPTGAGEQQGFVDTTNRRRQRDESDDDDEEPPPFRR